MNEGFGDLPHHGICIGKDIVVPKSQNDKSLITQPAVTFKVAFHLGSMLSAIQLHNQPRIKANIVHNVRAYRNLAAERIAAETVSAKAIP